MSNFFSQHRKQIVYAVLAITLVYLSILGYLFLTNKPQAAENTKLAVEEGKESLTPAISTAAGEKPAEKISDYLELSEEYSQSRFSIRIPKTWKILIIPFKGGETVMFQDEFYPKKPRLAIDAYDKPVDSAPKIDLYVKEGFVKTNTYLVDQYVTVLSGTMPYRMSDAKIIPGPMQQRVIFMPRSNALYTFKYYYDGDKEDPKFETFFREMMETTTFPK